MLAASVALRSATAIRTDDNAAAPWVVAPARVVACTTTGRPPAEGRADRATTAPAAATDTSAVPPAGHTGAAGGVHGSSESAEGFAAACDAAATVTDFAGAGWGPAAAAGEAGSTTSASKLADTTSATELANRRSRTPRNQPRPLPTHRPRTATPRSEPKRSGDRLDLRVPGPGQPAYQWLYEQ